MQIKSNLEHCLLPAGLREAQPAGSAFTQWSKNGFFAPRGDILPWWTWNLARGAPNFTFIGAKMWEYSPQNYQIFAFWPWICPSGATRLHSFYEILSVCTRLKVDFNFLIWSLSGDNQLSYKHFPAVGAFSHKFSIAPSGETTESAIKKVRGWLQKSYGPPLSYAKYGGIVGRAPAEDEKVWCFYVVCLSVFLLRFGMTKFVITKTLWSGVIFKTIMALLQVCSCAPIFTFFCGPPKFSLMGKFIPKIAIFRHV